MRAGRADIDGVDEIPLHQREAVVEIVRRAGEQEIGRPRRERAIEAAALQRAVEDARGKHERG